SQTLGDFFQGHVSHGVSEGIVDALEIVDIHQKDEHFDLFPVEPADLTRKSLLQSAPIEQLCQGIDQGQLLQGGVGQLQFPGHPTELANASMSLQGIADGSDQDSLIDGVLDQVV